MYRLQVFALCCALSASLVLSSPLNEAVKKANESGTNIWAVLVAGSNGYFNYRHQSDICHSYQILKKHGIPDERIIVFMYDDIAENRQNPRKGEIINRPGGPDVYKGVVKDYVGNDVNPENFLNVLKGNADALKGIGSGKVLKSGPKDHVFVYFSDHGAPGLIAFPDDELHRGKLNNAIEYMHDNKLYGKLVFYLEACESGSMFEKIRKDINAYTVTASNDHESSYACYYDKKLMTYLGDLFSISWMEDTDKMNIEQENLKKQFESVKKRTNASHVQEYGDLSISNMKVGQFQGLKNVEKNFTTMDNVITDAVSSRDVPLAIIANKIKYSKTHTEEMALRNEYLEMFQNRLIMDKTVQRIFTLAKGNKIIDWYAKVKLENDDCYERCVTSFKNLCYNISVHEYALAYLHKFVNLCENGVDASRTHQAMTLACNGVNATNPVL